ncbi:MAG: hypothetical protein GXO66_03605 [Euryarchaeota archaeon]|nr:hypothetical protein [Euryarchaeota archaeon]
MGVVSSFVTAWRLVLTTPALLLPALVYSLLSLPQMLLQFFYSGESAAVLAGGAAYSILMWLISPFFIAGLLVAARDALEGRASIDSFLKGGRRYYLYMLLASVIYILLIGAGFLALLFVALLLGLGAGAVLPGDASTVFVLIFLLLGGLTLLVLMILFNFYDVGVAIEGLDPVKTFRNSLSFVKSRPLSVLAFLLLSYFTVGIIYFPLLLTLLYHLISSLPSLTLEDLSTGALPRPGFGLGVLLTLLLIITSALATCFTYTYRAVFYLDVRR